MTCGKAKLRTGDDEDLRGYTDHQAICGHCHVSILAGACSWRACHQTRRETRAIAMEQR